jgi:predicted AlkP superfamily phosphohydrolase/phosphomutase
MVTPATSAPARVLVLGIDAASPELLTRWAADGTMPHLSALMARGMVGETRSVEGLYVGSTWPSVFTGVNPARHGVHYLFQLRPGSYEYQMATTRYPPFWDALSAAGKRLALIDVPLCQVSPGLNGIHVVDWSRIETTFGYDTAPPELREEIAARWMYPLQEPCDGLRQGSAEFGAFTDQLVRGVAMRTELVSHYLARGGWDLFMQVFTEAHGVGHQCWHLHDPAHPAHDAGIAREIGDPFRRVYRAIDESIGRLVEQAGDATVLVFTAHGMSFWYGAQVLLPDILVRLGVTQPLAAPAAPSSSSVLRRTARSVWRLLPESIRRRLAPARSRSARPNDVASAPRLGVDTATSRCFMVRNGNITGGIRLNLIGREATGVLAPGAEADAFTEQLIQDLEAIVDERTGRPVAKRVWRASELYPGSCLDDLPDLLVDWDDAVPTGSLRHGGGAAATVRVRSPKFGVLEKANEYTRTGDHRIGGMFVAAGPGIPAGRTEEVYSIMDYAPTLAAMLGVPLADLDGRPISPLLGADKTSA